MIVVPPASVVGVITAVSPPAPSATYMIDSLCPAVPSASVRASPVPVVVTSWIEPVIATAPSPEVAVIPLVITAPPTVAPPVRVDAHVTLKEPLAVTFVVVTGASILPSPSMILIPLEYNSEPLERRMFLLNTFQTKLAISIVLNI